MVESRIYTYSLYFNPSSVFKLLFSQSKHLGLGGTEGTRPVTSGINLFCLCHLICIQFCIGSCTRSQVWLAWSKPVKLYIFFSKILLPMKLEMCCSSRLRHVKFFIGLCGQPILRSVGAFTVRLQNHWVDTIELVILCERARRFKSKHFSYAGRRIISLD